MKITDIVSIQVTRSLDVVFALIWLMLFVLFFLCLVWAFQKFIESLVEKEKRKNWKKYLMTIFLLALGLACLIWYATFYSPTINLIKPIANWFNIPY